MVQTLKRSLMLKDEEGPVKRVSSTLQQLISTPFGFPYTGQLKPEAQKQFISNCAFMRKFFDEFSQIEQDDTLRQFMLILANCFYYENDDIKRQKVSSTMRSKAGLVQGVRKSERNQSL